MKKTIAVLTIAAAACINAMAAVSEPNVLWQKGDNDIGVYRIPALCTAPNGDLVAACDARKNHGGDLNSNQPINITIRRSTDNGRTWSRPVNSWTWTWNNEEHWAGSDPSFIVDKEAGKIFLFYNVWECIKQYGIYQFYVQESSDNGRTWSKPRNISSDIAFEGWPFGKPDREGGFIFITSGSGVQLKDGTLVHTLVHVNDGNALFCSTDHGQTWKPMGKPAKPGDECKVVELSDGALMINSRWRGGGRQIHVTKDRGETWQSYYDTDLLDGECNAQIMRYGKVLLFSNCNMGGRRRCNLFVRASTDDGKTWNKGVCIEPGGAAYSDMTIMNDGNIGVLFEGAGYSTIKFVSLPRADVAATLAPDAL